MCSQDLPEPYCIARPAVYFTDFPFKDSRSMASVATTTTTITTTNTSNDGPYLVGIVLTERKPNFNAVQPFAG